MLYSLICFKWFKILFCVHYVTWSVICSSHMVFRTAVWAKCELVCAHVCLRGGENGRSTIRLLGKIQLAHRMAIRHHRGQTQPTQLAQAHGHSLAFASSTKAHGQAKTCKASESTPAVNAGSLKGSRGYISCQIPAEALNCSRLCIQLGSFLWEVWYKEF